VEKVAAKDRPTDSCNKEYVCCKCLMETESLVLKCCADLTRGRSHPGLMIIGIRSFSNQIEKISLADHICSKALNSKVRLIYRQHLFMPSRD
jgi:hypothetical protein